VKIGTKKWASLSPGNVPCGIEAGTNNLLCWGYTAGESYALGSPLTSTPMLVSGNIDWASVSGGIEGTRCGVDVQGNVYCWGRSVYDCDGSCPIGDGTEKNRAGPTKVRGALVAENARVGKPPIESDTVDTYAGPEEAAAPDISLTEEPGAALAPSVSAEVLIKPAVPLAAFPVSAFENSNEVIAEVPRDIAVEPSPFTGDLPSPGPAATSESIFSAGCQGLILSLLLTSLVY